jgi:FkbM family methyltransferase
MSNPEGFRSLGLRHYDLSQLAPQIAEIVDRRIYLQHGVDVKEGDVVLDVGGNVGVAAAFFAHECGASTVHSFEPVAPLYELLRENLSRFPACSAHGYGLSSKAGIAQITFYPQVAVMSGLYADRDLDMTLLRRAMTNLGLSEKAAASRVAGCLGLEMTCELRTLSEVRRELGIEQVDLLKIDVERAELDVLLGIGDRDWPSIRQIVAEVHEDAHATAIEGMLLERGFNAAWEQDRALAGTPTRLVFATRL